MYKYINSVKFSLVHINNLIPVQSWISLDALKEKEKLKVFPDMYKKNPGTQFNEYFLEITPIKVSEIEGKYYIIDGHHRFYRGLLNNYKYFLVEHIGSLYKPCNNQMPLTIDVFLTRPENDYDLKNYRKVKKFCSNYKEEEELLKDLIKKLSKTTPYSIFFNRYVSRL